MVKDPKTLTLSPTKVDTFFGCRRLFKYNYLAPPFPQKDNKYFVIGNIAHKVLEECHKIGMLGKINWKRDASHFFKQAYKTYKVKEKLRSGMLTAEDVASIKTMIKKYITYIKSDELPNVFSVEKLSKVSIGGAVVWLKSDRVDKLDKNTYRVVDYKSGRVATKKDELASVQLPSYGIWIRQTVDPKAVVKGMYIYLKEVDKPKGRHVYDITDEMMQAAEDKYAQVRKLIANPKCEYNQNFDYKYCFFCDYKPYCVKDDRDEL